MITIVSKVVVSYPTLAKVVKDATVIWNFVTISAPVTPVVHSAWYKQLSNSINSQKHTTRTKARAEIYGTYWLQLFQHGIASVHVIVINRLRSSQWAVAISKNMRVELRWFVLQRICGLREFYLLTLGEGLYWGSCWRKCIDSNCLKSIFTHVDN